MTRPIGKHDLELQRIFDRLGVTPQQFLDFHEDSARKIVIGINDVIWTPAPRRGWGWPFVYLWRINLDTLDQKLKSTFDALGIGYCYMIKRKGKFVHFGTSGWAQLPGDGDIRWMFHIPMHVASVSKFITAIATIRLLRDLKIPVTDRIIGYLPQYWTFGPRVDAITFEDLLRHESGLAGHYAAGDPGLTTFRAARDEIKTGSSGNGAGTRNYKNVNYALLRILFATLAGGLPTSYSVFPHVSFFGIQMDPDHVADDNFWDFTSLSAYSNYVNDVVFTTASMNPRGFEFPENAAKAYRSPPVAPGWVDGNTSFGAGAMGWYLNVGELIRLAGEFRRGGSIMGTWRAKNMMTHLYGFEDPLETHAGSVYWKGGRWGAAPQVHDSGIFLMPGDSELAILFGSAPPPPPLPPGSPPGTPPPGQPSHMDAVQTAIQDSAEPIWSISIGP